jgi:hypothetical protein
MISLPHPMRRKENTFKLRMFDLAFKSDLKAIRLMLGMGAVFIGLGFLWPVQVFPTAEQLAAGTGRHTYALMARIAPEWLWGSAFLLQGIVMLWSLLLDYRNNFLLWVDACFGSILWTVSIGACYLAYWHGFDNLMSYRPPAIMGGEVAAALAS